MIDNSAAPAVRSTAALEHRFRSIGAIVDDAAADPVEVCHRQRRRQHLFEAGVGGGDGHDRTVAGDNPQQAIDFDDLERVDAESTRSAATASMPFLDGARPGRRVQGRHPADTKERASVEPHRRRIDSRSGA